MNQSNNNNGKVLKNQYKTLAKNSFYSILHSYGMYIFALITSALLARMISKEAWGFLIIANSIIALLNLINNLNPPGLYYSLIYYIPRFRSKKEYGKLR
ncbi:MAG: hypothetical protein ACFFC1_11010, partial [Promethearchaeota archaeon]